MSNRMPPNQLVLSLRFFTSKNGKILTYVSPQNASYFQGNSGSTLRDNDILMSHPSEFIVHLPLTGQNKTYLSVSATLNKIKKLTRQFSREKNPRPPTGFEPAFPTLQWLQNYALCRTATGSAQYMVIQN